MKGPCLCGDPYCPSCGDPGAEAWGDFIEEALGRFQECLDGADQSIPDPNLVAMDSMERFLNDNIEWLAESYNTSRAGPEG